MTDNMHNTICEAMSEAGLKPVTFPKPLKNIHALVKLAKVIEPRNLSERSQAVGWGIGRLLDGFNKELFHVKSFIMTNDIENVTLEALVYVHLATFEEDHVGYLDGYVELMASESTSSHGYALRHLYWNWDTAERVSDVMVFTQNSGEPGG